MPLIKWRDSFSVGVPQFDEDHMKLLGIVNEMFTIVRDQKGPEHLNVQIDTLIQYSIDHFAAEEEAMEKAGYPALKEHKEIHSKLLDDVTAFKKQVGDGKKETVVSFYHFLRDWLLTHIVEEDVKYTPFLADTGKTSTTV